MTTTVDRIVEAVKAVKHDKDCVIHAVYPRMCNCSYFDDLRSTIASVLDEKVTDEQLVEILADKAGHSKEFVTANLKAAKERNASEISVFASQALAALRAVRDRCARPEWVKVKKIIDDLNNMSNKYEVVDGCYVIQKTTLDHYIEQLESAPPVK